MRTEQRLTGLTFLFHTPRVAHGARIQGCSWRRGLEPAEGHGSRTGTDPEDDEGEADCDAPVSAILLAYRRSLLTDTKKRWRGGGTFLAMVDTHKQNRGRESAKVASRQVFFVLFTWEAAS